MEHGELLRVPGAERWGPPAVPLAAPPAGPWGLAEGPALPLALAQALGLG
jgi:hypothetical protein